MFLRHSELADAFGGAEEAGVRPPAGRGAAAAAGRRPHEERAEVCGKFIFNRMTS